MAEDELRSPIVEGSISLENLRDNPRDFAVWLCTDINSPINGTRVRDLEHRFLVYNSGSDVVRDYFEFVGMEESDSPFFTQDAAHFNMDGENFQANSVRKFLLVNYEDGVKGTFIQAIYLLGKRRGELSYELVIPHKGEVSATHNLATGEMKEVKIRFYGDKKNLVWSHNFELSGEKLERVMDGIQIRQEVGGQVVNSRGGSERLVFEGGMVTINKDGDGFKIERHVAGKSLDEIVIPQVLVRRELVEKLGLKGHLLENPWSASIDLDNQWRSADFPEVCGIKWETELDDARAIYVHGDELSTYPK